MSRFEILYQKANRTDYRIVFAVDQANEPIALAPVPILNIDPAALTNALAAVRAASAVAESAADSGGDIQGAA